MSTQKTSSLADPPAILQCRHWMTRHDPVFDPDSNRWIIPKKDEGLCQKLDEGWPRYGWGCDRRWHAQGIPACCELLRVGEHDDEQFPV